MYSSLEDLRRQLHALPQPDAGRIDAARARQMTLTKPPGSLGRLEDIACFLAGWQNEGPRAARIEVLVFAGNHGVVAQGISPYPADVTVQMVANFERGGAAINALCKAGGLTLKVVPIELDNPSADFTENPALTEAEFLAALAAGAETVDPASDLVALGEMGIGNTTVAAALAAASLGGTGTDWAGAGTGLDGAGIRRKAAVIDRALARHDLARADPLAIACALGGRELAAIAGAALRARQLSIPVILDGFVATAALAPLFKEEPGSLAHCLAGHRSHEQAHGRLLAQFGLTPILDLGMRLGEGSGAALAAGIVRAAVATHRSMATFAEAGVSNADG